MTNEHKEITAGVTPQAIRVQLERIVSSDGFVRSRRMQRFLEFVVEETLSGRADQLGEYSIAVAVFDRPEAFDPALDPIVRNDARRLRLKLFEYYRHLQNPAPNHVLIDVPKGGYVPVFRLASASHVEAPPRLPRLAVLPFDVLSATSESTMYGHALCMSLTAGITNLGGIEALAYGYSGEQPIREAAARLRLTHVINGSLFEAGRRCQVTINLIHAQQGTQLWARQYEFPVGEILTILSEMTRSVVREVTSMLGLQRPQPRSFTIAA